MRSGGRAFGNLYLTEKPGGFDEDDERLIAVLAAQAGAAIENAELAERLRSLAVAGERDRISRELHDGVIQALFSIGLGLESARTVLRTDPTGWMSAAELAREYEVHALVRPELQVDAGIDGRVPARIVPDLLALVREALANCAKHAGAATVVVAAHADAARVEVVVSDDGVGFALDAPRVGRGPDTMHERAAVLGGALEIDSAPGRGTTVRLEVPLEA